MKNEKYTHLKWSGECLEFENSDHFIEPYGSGFVLLDENFELISFGGSLRELIETPQKFPKYWKWNNEKKLLEYSYMENVSSHFIEPYKDGFVTFRKDRSVMLVSNSLTQAIEEHGDAIGHQGGGAIGNTRHP